MRTGSVDDRSRTEVPRRIRLRVVTPTVPQEEFSAMVAAIVGTSSETLDVEHTFIDEGPPCVDSYVSEALAAPGTIRRVVEAERDGVHGVLINCMADPALFAAREAASIPVLATGQTSLQLAAILGHRIGVLDVLESCRTMTFDHAARHGLLDRLASFRAVEIGVLDIEKDVERAAQRLAREAELAILEDHADVLVLGCGAFVAAVPRLTTLLAAKRLDVPVIDPLSASIGVLTAVVGARLRHSKRAFPTR